MVLTRTLRAFTSHPAIDATLVVINANDQALYDAAAASLAHEPSPLLAPVTGGATRQQSVLAGLEALVPRQPASVLIHDAARPFVSRLLISRVIAGLNDWPGIVPALAVTDTLKRADANGRILDTVERTGLWRAQTPQAFNFGAILDAHRAAAAAGRTGFTDDASIAEWHGLSVGLVAGEETNRKLTTAGDLAMASSTTMSGGRDLSDIRMATGFDVHRFKAGDHVWLCGVRIPHDCALEGHSDADVGLHALTDAILGAIADGDIGQHFPPGDPQWRGAASHLFLADAMRRLRARGGELAHADVTLLCERPKIGPHRDAMRARIARICDIAIDRVAVKATTTEGLGFTGRREGIAAQAAATVRLPARAT